MHQPLDAGRLGYTLSRFNYRKFVTLIQNAQPKVLKSKGPTIYLFVTMPVWHWNPLNTWLCVNLVSILYNQRF